MTVPSRPLVELVGPRAQKFGSPLDAPVIGTLPWATGNARRAGRLPGADPEAAQVSVIAPLGIPPPYATDDGGMAYPAGTWMLLNGHAVPFTSWQKTNPLELQLYTPPLVGLAPSAWAGPSEADVFGLPVGQTATVTLVDEVGTVVATQTIDGNGALQTVAFPAELLNRRTVGQRTRSVIISATVTVSARIRKSMIRPMAAVQAW